MSNSQKINVEDLSDFQRIIKKANDGEFNVLGDLMNIERKRRMK